MALFRVTASRLAETNQVLPTLSILLRNLSDASTDLKSVLEKKIPAEQERVKTFRKEFGNKVVGDVTVDM
ncbi:hypothetical protein FOCC_FOCC014045, partial [Frankliniella occidentalis]